MKHKLYGYRRWRWILTASLILTAGICHSCGRERDAVSLQPYMADDSVLGDRAAEEGIPQAQSAENAASGTGGSDGDTADTGGKAEEGKPAGRGAVCYVHICGAVVSPGVYEIEEGQRIYQVVEQAGGYTQDAAADYLNLAAPVADGMKLIVPTQEELLKEPEKHIYGAITSQEAAADDKPAKVNLNTATKEQLMGLNGIGEAKAGDIIRYREKHGGFQKIEDIMKIPGIKDAAFQKIKDEITV